MATVSILTHPLTNASPSTFSESSQAISSSSNPPFDQPQPSAPQFDGDRSMDAMIIDALRGRDRSFVLELEEQMEALINEHKSVALFTYSVPFCSFVSHRRQATISLVSPTAVPLPYAC